MQFTGEQAEMFTNLAPPRAFCGRSALRFRPAPYLRLERSEGQALVLTAMLIVVLLLFVGLGVDVGNLMARRAKLQSAVDTSALSAAQMLASNASTDPDTKARQIFEANGIPATSLASPLVVEPSPELMQVRVAAVQRVETYFMRLLPGFETVNITAQATADLTSYAEINAKPFGQPGVVNQVTLMVWGRDSGRGKGDAYSPQYRNTSGAINPHHSQMPYGYLYRIDVPADYRQNYGDYLVVEIWDADTYNRFGNPPQYGNSTSNTTRDSDEFASCGNPSSGDCTTNGQPQNTGLKLDAFPDRKPAFWRVDEYRHDYDHPQQDDDFNAWQPAAATRTTFTLWHFNPHITSAFGDPAQLTDSDSGGPIAVFDIKDCEQRNGNRCLFDGTVVTDHPTDLRWTQPSGFRVDLRQYAREDNGRYYFYLYVKGHEGSSENNYDLRVGPPQPLECTDAMAAHCYSNTLYRDLNYSATFQQFLRNNGYVAGTELILWKDGGARIVAKRALPLNLATGVSFPLNFTQISRNAAGQTLGVRHFDQDCNTGCGTAMQYQMQICGCTDVNNDACWQDIATGAVGPDNGWSAPGYPDPERIYIPEEGTTLFNTFFGTGVNACETSLLRLKQHPSYAQDSTVWEMPFIRPRLIR